MRRNDNKNNMLTVTPRNAGAGSAYAGAPLKSLNFNRSQYILNFYNLFNLSVLAPLR